MEKNNSLFYIIENFINEKDSNILINFFDQNDYLADDLEVEHKHRNIHYQHIKDTNILSILDYYANKNIFFIDHLFQTKVKLWSSMRICRWLPGDSMRMHIDKNTTQRNSDMNYSSLLYLNDDYEGGELIFRDQVFKMKKFSCIFFESDLHKHGVNTLLKNKRYTIPSWYKIK